MTLPLKTVVILGGYGTFGSRLVRLLAPRVDLRIVVAGRSRSKAEALARSVSAQAVVEAYAMDRDGNVELAFNELRPDLVVDASGPFQGYGNNPYRVGRAAIKAGAHYCDLADDGAFVAGIAMLDEDARAAGVFALSGLSSAPALSGAAMRHLGQGVRRVTNIEAGIAPSPKVDMGLNVMRAIAGYAGKSVDGRMGAERALMDSRVRTLRVPGVAPLGPLRFSLVDVPDYRLVGNLFQAPRDVWFGAATRPAILQRLLGLLAWFPRFGIPISSFAPLMVRAKSWFRFGSHRGGMYVSLRGEETGERSVVRTWSLIADGDDGPYIPAIASAAVICNWLDGKSPQAGARPAIDALSLADFAPFLSSLRIEHGEFEEREGAPPQSLYRRVLGSAYDRLPGPIQNMHEFCGRKIVSGRATVERGHGFLARSIAWFMRFPKAGNNVPVVVTFEKRDDREIWQRDFDGRKFKSTQEAGTGTASGLILERLGPVSVGLAIIKDGEKLRVDVVKWWLLSLRMPNCLSPGGNTFEHAADGRFNFHVEMTLPLVGLIVRYKGFLEPQKD